MCGPLLGGAFLAPLVASELLTGFCFTERVIPAERAVYAVQYHLRTTFSETLPGQRVAMIDDVMSAGPTGVLPAKSFVISAGLLSVPGRTVRSRARDYLVISDVNSGLYVLEAPWTRR